jgi:hypothetical protein
MITLLPAFYHPPAPTSAASVGPGAQVLPWTPGLAVFSDTMDTDQERERGLDLGRRWAEHVVSGSFDDLSQILPPDSSDQFIAGFREGVLEVWHGGE